MATVYLHLSLAITGRMPILLDLGARNASTSMDFRTALGWMKSR